MAFSDEMFEKTFPVRRSPKDKGHITDVRIYWNDQGTVLLLNGVPLTGSPGEEKNTAEALDTFERLIARATSPGDETSTAAP